MKRLLIALLLVAPAHAADLKLLIKKQLPCLVDVNKPMPAGTYLAADKTCRSSFRFKKDSAQ